MPEKRFFFDTISLSNFAIAGRLDLLVDRYGASVQVTQEVLGEVTDGVVAGYHQLRGIEAAVARGEFSASGPLSPIERDDYRELLHFLGSGEGSCIACAQSRVGGVVTDDRAARSVCTDRHITVTGTIGILKASAVDGALSPQRADEILQEIVDSGFYAPVRRISDLL